MAFSGVRSSWDMLARNSDLALLALSALTFSVSYLRASSASCSWLRSRPVMAFCSCSSLRRRASSWVLMAVMSAAVMTRPPSAVRRSLIWIQRPSISSASRTPLAPSGAGWSCLMARAAKRLTSARAAPGFRIFGSSEKTLR